MKWSSWVQMVWCYHLREAHVPSSLFCLLNSGSKVFAQKCRMYLSKLKIYFFKIKTCIWDSLMLSPPPFCLFNISNSSSSRARAFNLESKDNSREFYTLSFCNNDWIFSFPFSVVANYLVFWLVGDKTVELALTYRHD